MDADNYRDKTVPSAGSLYEEAQALMFAGADTVGVTLMIGTHHMLQDTTTLQKLKKDLLIVWPSLAHEPTLRELENLPYLDAVIKESLRLASGVVTGLVRVVPSTGAVIAGHAVPPGVRRSV
jgi:cytochrome P450